MGVKNEVKMGVKGGVKGGVKWELKGANVYLIVFLVLYDSRCELRLCHHFVAHEYQSFHG